MSNINFFRLMGKNSGAATPSPPTCEEWYEGIGGQSSYQLSFPNSESFQRGGVYVDEGGTRLYISQGWNTTNDLSTKVYQFSMSTPHNMSTISFIGSGSTSFNSSDQSSSINGFGLHFSDDGTKLYRTLSGNGALCRWDLSTAWDITSVNSTVAQRANFLPYLTYSSASINTVYSQSSNISFTQDGLNLIMGHQQKPVGSQLPGPMYVKQYEMNTAWDLSSIVELSGSSVTYLSNTGSASSIYFYGTDIGYIDPGSNNTDNFFVKNLDTSGTRPVYQYYFTNGTGNNLVGKTNIGANSERTYLKVVNKNYMYGIGSGLGAKLKQNNIDWSDVCIPPTQFTPPPTDSDYMEWENVTSPTTVTINAFMGSNNGSRSAAGIWVTPNEDKISFLDGVEQKIRIANFNTSGDITQGFTLQNSSSTLPVYFRNHMYNPAGTKVFGLIQTGGSSPVINFSEYSLSTAFDVSTISSTVTTKIDLNSADSTFGATFNSDGTQLIIIQFKDGDINNKFLVYNLSTAYTLSSADSGSLTNSGLGTQGWIFNFEKGGNEYLLGQGSFNNFVYYNGYTNSDRVNEYSNSSNDLYNVKFALDRDKIYGSYTTYSASVGLTYYLQKYGYYSLPQ